MARAAEGGEHLKLLVATLVASKSSKGYMRDFSCGASKKFFLGASIRKCTAIDAQQIHYEGPPSKRTSRMLVFEEIMDVFENQQQSIAWDNYARAQGLHWMAKQVAPVTLTGGEGFNNEDRIAARLLVDMLSGIPSFGADFGRVIRIDWQARDSHRLLDDLAITLSSSAGTHVAELSIKSDRQVSGGGFPDNFVEAAWEQWFHVVDNRFNRQQDLLVLVVGKVANDVEKAWSTLLRQSLATTNDRILRRLKEPQDDSGSQFSATARSLFNSLHCTAPLVGKGQSDESATVDLLRRIRLLNFDLETQSSRDLLQAYSDCQRLLKDSSIEEAKRLWETLVGIASENRGIGGTIDLPSLVSRLQGSFRLAEHPDFDSDWKKLKGLTDELFSETRSVIGDGTSINRESEMQRIQSAFGSTMFCLLAGESGTGKSALAKSVAIDDYEHVVALLPEDCDVVRLNQLDANLGIANALVDVLRSSRDRTLLILDSLEKFSDRALKTAVKLLREATADTHLANLHVLLICQTDFVQHVVPKFSGSGLVPFHLEVVQITAPRDDAIKPVLMKMAGIGWATLNLELRPLLRNLKILDWVVRAVQSGTTINMAMTTGLVELIDHLWHQWIEAGDRGIAGGGLLKKIASLEAESLTVGVPFTQLEHAEQGSLSSLMLSDLLKRKSERVMFAHDLLGDWARLRVLIGEDPTASSNGIHRASMVRWHKAVRLFGSWLLSQKNGLGLWASALKRSEEWNSVQGTIVRDLLLDSVSLNENSRDLLGRALPLLCQNEGKLLKQMLDRFLFVATYPDWNFIQAIGNDKSSPMLEAQFRVPLWPYWGNMLHCLNQHIDAVRIHAPTEAVRICKLWLEKVPAKTSANMPFPFRESAARVALEIAKDCQVGQAAGKHVKTILEKTSYQTTLLAAQDLPDEVATFALEMAKRRPFGPEIQSRVDTLKAKEEESRRQWEQENPLNVEQLRQLEQRLPIFDEGEWVGPWPDGPSERVAHSFREAVFDDVGLVQLAEVCPDAAFEVLLAVFIKAPHRKDPFSSDFESNYGLTSYREVEPPMYFHGPFLLLFRMHPERGITFALKLINFATTRWSEHETRYRNRHQDELSEISILEESQDRNEVLIRVGETDRTWIGDRRVLRWYLDWPVHNKIIPCVLMALEKYLYEELDSGKDVNPLIAKIMEESKSIAFAGLLIDVGKKHPELFITGLQPLLGVAEFYLWEPRILLERSSNGVGLMGWWNQPKALSDIAREWHSASHRKCELRRIAILHMLSSREMERFFSECSERWAIRESECVDGIGRTILAEHLNRDNYQRIRNFDGDLGYKYVHPQELVDSVGHQASDAMDNVRRMSFPVECRKILDGEQHLAIEQCDSFWHTAIWIEAQPRNSEDDEENCEASIAGVIAVFANVHLDWLTSNPECVKWCFERLERFATQPPKRRRFEMPDSPGGWEWDCFVSEAAVGLLRVFGEQPFVRQLAAAGVAGFRYETTEKTMTLAHRYRASIGKDFELMQQLAIHWSLIRCQWNLCESYLAPPWKEYRPGKSKSKKSKEEAQLEETSKRWNKEYGLMIDGFVKGTLPTLGFIGAGKLGHKEAVSILDTRFPARKKQAPGKDSHRTHHRLSSSDRGLDGKILSSAFVWLGSPLTSSLDERRFFIAKIRDLIQMTLNWIMPNQDDDDVDNRPGDFESWVFGIASHAIVRIKSDEAPDTLWKPILQLNVEARAWIEDFFWQWFTDGVRATQDAHTFCERWSEMIEFALASPNWIPGNERRSANAD